MSKIRRPWLWDIERPFYETDWTHGPKQWGSGATWTSYRQPRKQSRTGIRAQLPIPRSIKSISRVKKSKTRNSYLRSYKIGSRLWRHPRKMLSLHDQLKLCFIGRGFPSRNEAYKRLQAYLSRLPS